MDRNLSIQLGLFAGAVLLLILAIFLQSPMIPKQNPDLVTLTASIDTQSFDDPYATNDDSSSGLIVLDEAETSFDDLSTFETNFEPETQF